MIRSLVPDRDKQFPRGPVTWMLPHLEMASLELALG